MIFNAPLSLIGYKITRSSIRQCLFKIISPILRSRLYNRLYSNPELGILNFQTLNFWPGNANRGAKLVNGNFEYEGMLLENSAKPWLAKNVSDAWLAKVLQFDWLQDLRAVGTDGARNRAKDLIDMLDVLRDKTKGNLTEDEEKIMSETLLNLKNLYINALNTDKEKEKIDK